MHWTRPKIIVVLVATVVLVGAVSAGHHLLADSSRTTAGRAKAAVAAPAPRIEQVPVRAPSTDAAAGIPKASSAHAPSTPSGGSGSSSLPEVPVSAVTPLVIHTAVIDLHVGKGELDPVLHTMALLAASDGGYVNSSSVSGGTARRSPVAGTMSFRVLDSDFNDAIGKVTTLGTVESQKMNGQDVTFQVARNSASITVLQDEVNLLETKLAEATDINTFLSIQSQLFSVEQQLQQLQSSEAVLENSAALATVTVNLTAPGALVIPAPRPRAGADAGATAWRYLRHNTLAVMDGLAVAFGWALPVLLLFGLVGLIALRVVRRRRRVINPA